MRSGLKYFLSVSFIIYLLGLFVDQFDMALFSIVRVSSLKALGLTSERILTDGVFLYNVQMVGMLVGGLFGGILGDKRGRKALLFASIILYVAGNIANVFVTSINQYAICRFVCGFGLAAEVGACVTLIIETIPRRLASYGIMLLIGVGHIGSFFAAFVVSKFDWRTSYLIGGILGIMLLLTRTLIRESAMFEKVKIRPIPRGDLRKIFLKASNLLKFIKGVLVGTPNYVVGAVFIVFAPEILKAVGVLEPVNLVVLMPYVYVGMVLGDFFDGWLSQRLMNRKLTLVGYQLALIAVLFYYFSLGKLAFVHIKVVMFGLGFVSGQWVVINTIAAEQFGTDIRATVATMTPNLIRVSAVLMTLMLTSLKESLGIVYSAIIVAVVWLSLSMISAVRIQDTFKKEIDYCEGETYQNWV